MPIEFYKSSDQMKLYMCITVIFQNISVFELVRLERSLNKKLAK